MSVKLVENDFLEGGIFYHLILTKELPLPKEILEHIYGKCCHLDKFVQIMLLKKIWKLKGVEMCLCLCLSDDHLVTKDELAEQLAKENQIKIIDFEENGIFESIPLCNNDSLPINNLILNHVWGGLSYYNEIPEGKCFKSDEYQILLLQEVYKCKYHSIYSEICDCKKHLILFDKK